MTNNEIKEIERVFEKPIKEVEKTDIPSYIRAREKAGAKGKLGIQITLTLDGEELTYATAESFEIAEMELGSLERWYKKELDRQEADAERGEEKI